MPEEMNEDKFIGLATAADETKLPMIILFQDIDGNWRGGMHKEGKEIYVRAIGPETVLQLLLTHDGQTN